MSTDVRERQARRTVLRECVRTWALWLGIILLSAGALGCSNEAEQVVETWEELGELIEEHRDDCGELAEALTEFEEDNGEMFSADTKPLYEEIHADPDLRFRMERAFAQIEAEDFECRDDEAVQKAASSLFGDILEATETNDAEDEARNPEP